MHIVSFKRNYTLKKGTTLINYGYLNLKIASLPVLKLEQKITQKN